MLADSTGRVFLSDDERSFLLDCIMEATREPPPETTAYLDPGNYLGRIEHIWAYSEMLERAKAEIKVLWPRTGKPPTEEAISMVANMAAAFALHEIRRIEAGAVADKLTEQPP
jgi:hypothetical protein